MSEKSQGVLFRSGALAGWAIVTYLWVKFVMWYAFVLYLLIHLIEAFTIGLKRGRAAGYSTADLAGKRERTK